MKLDRSSRRSPLRFIGGKSYIADWIVSNFPPHKVYVEVFGGGASVLFAKPRSKIEVYNDIWDDLVCFFRVLRDNPEGLKNYLRYLPYSRNEFERYREKWLKREFRDEIERAAAIFYLSRSSIDGDFLSSGFSSSIKRNSSESYRETIESLEEFSERLRGVIIENLDFRDLIPKYDSRDTLFYCDPPYFGLSHYPHGFEYRDHYELSKMLKRIEGKFALSYYEDPRVYELYPPDEFVYLKKDVPKWSSLVREEEGEKRPRAIELLILNYDPPRSTSKKRSLREVFG